MRRETWLVGVLVLGGLAVPARAQVQLEWKFKDKFYVEVVRRFQTVANPGGQERKLTSETTAVFGVTLLKRNPGGSLVLEHSIESMNSDDDPILKRMAGGAVRVTLDPNMNVSKMEGIEELVTRTLGDKVEPAERQTAQKFFEYFLGQLIGSAWTTVPGKPVRKGDGWQQTPPAWSDPIVTLAVKNQFVYEGREKRDGREVEKVAITGTVSAALSKDKEKPFPFKVVKFELKKQDYQGTLYFDAPAGRTARSEVRLVAEVSTQVEGQKEAIESRIEQSFTVRTFDKNPAPK